MRRVISALLLVVVVGLVAVGCASGKDATVYGGSFTFTSPGGQSEFSYPVGERQQVGEMSGPDLTGKKTISLSDYKGKVVVLNFWGSWCPGCRDEAQGLEASWQRYQDQGVQFVGVDVKDPQGAGQAYATSKGITYPSIYDFGMRTLLSVRGLPTGSLPVTIVLDKQGKVAHIWLDEITEGDLNTVIPGLVKET